MNFFPFPRIETQFLGRLAIVLDFISTEQSCLQGQAEEQRKLPVFRRIYKIAESDYQLCYVSVCLSVRVGQFGYCWKDFHRVLYLRTFRNSFEKVQISLGTALAQWLRCCATNRKVAGSILDGVIGIFH